MYLKVLYRFFFIYFFYGRRDSREEGPGVGRERESGGGRGSGGVREHRRETKGKVYTWPQLSLERKRDLTVGWGLRAESQRLM